MMMTEHVICVSSPTEIQKDYSNALGNRVDAWMTTIQTEIKKWWTNALQDCVVIELVPFMDPELKLDIIDRLQTRGWSVREGNNGRFLILHPKEDVPVTTGGDVK